MQLKNRMDVHVLHRGPIWQVAALTVSSNDMHDFVLFQIPLLFRGGEVMGKSSSGFGFSLKL